MSHRTTCRQNPCSCGAHRNPAARPKLAHDVAVFVYRQGGARSGKRTFDVIAAHASGKSSGQTLHQEVVTGQKDAIATAKRLAKSYAERGHRRVDVMDDEGDTLATRYAKGEAPPPPPKPFPPSTPWEDQPETKLPDTVLQKSEGHGKGWKTVYGPATHAAVYDEMVARNTAPGNRSFYRSISVSLLPPESALPTYDNPARASKTEVLHVIQGSYGQGWEDVSAYKDSEHKIARAELRTYNREEPNYAHRLIKRRVPKRAATPTAHENPPTYPNMLVGVGPRRQEPAPGLLADVLFMAEDSGPFGMSTVETSMQAWLRTQPSFAAAVATCPRADWLFMLVGLAMHRPYPDEMTRDDRRRLTAAGLELVRYVLARVSPSVREEFETGAVFPKAPSMRGIVRRLEQFVAHGASLDELREIGRAAQYLDSLHDQRRARLNVRPRRDEHVLHNLADLLASVAATAEPTYLPPPGQGTEVLVSSMGYRPEWVARQAGWALGTHSLDQDGRFDAEMHAMAPLIRPILAPDPEALERQFHSVLRAERAHFAAKKEQWSVEQTQRAEAQLTADTARKGRVRTHRGRVTDARQGQMTFKNGARPRDQVRVAGWRVQTQKGRMDALTEVRRAEYKKMGERQAPPYLRVKLFPDHSHPAMENRDGYGVAVDVVIVNADPRSSAVHRAALEQAVERMLRDRVIAAEVIPARSVASYVKHPGGSETGTIHLDEQRLPRPASHPNPDTTSVEKIKLWQRGALTLREARLFVGPSLESLARLSRIPVARLRELEDGRAMTQKELDSLRRVLHTPGFRETARGVLTLTNGRPQKCRKTGCLGYGHGGLCPACAKKQVKDDLRREGWSEEQIQRAYTPSKHADELMAILEEGETLLPPQGEA